ncbi:beta-ketoacyl-ACP synthase II [Anaplasmataceae bacterium AB001_6]|nr:beta-ketoacyl-ACP synthase II [Anaplasmataceae bacterium AB001_6]
MSDLSDSRIVITGMGLLCPAGENVKDSWNGIISSTSFTDTITSFDPSSMRSKVAGSLEVSKSLGCDIFEKAKKLKAEEQYGITHSVVKASDEFILYGLVAAAQAIEDSGFVGSVDMNRVGLTVGSGIGGLQYIEKSCFTLKDRGARRISPYFIPSSLVNLLSGQISIQHGIMGPSDSCVTACATGCHSIINAIRIIRQGEADIVVAGGAESAICEIGIAGFDAMRALSSKFNDTPQKASRPWDKNRDGFVMAEGAGILVVESYESAVRRGAKIYAEIVGYGCSSDAFHYAAPREDGRGAISAMRNALKKADISVDKIGYVNAHGTSTPVGDKAELLALKEVFGEHCNNIAVSSTKSSIGHALGAAGAIETILTIMSLNKGILPPTINLEEPDDYAEGINLVPNYPQDKVYDYALKNSFGFGGMNASLIFKKIR